MIWCWEVNEKGWNTYHGDQLCAGPGAVQVELENWMAHIAIKHGRFCEKCTAPELLEEMRSRS